MKVNYNFVFFFFFARKNRNNSKVNTDDASLLTSNVDIPIFENPQIKFQKIKINEINISVGILLILNRY